MGKEIRGIIVDEIEKEQDSFKKMELITIAIREQFEYSKSLEDIISSQKKALEKSALFADEVSKFMDLSTKKIVAINDHLSKNEITESLDIAREIKLLKQNLKELYEYIINTK